MDGNCFNPDYKGGGVDRISDLPDEIIIVILSFLSLREAARTSTLSSRWLDLWKHNPDRISQLPDRIIAVILSSLPLWEAARTSVLSSRWLDLWKHTPNLNFITDTLNFDIDTLAMMHQMQNGSPPSWDADKCKYFHLVNSVLQSHKAHSLKQFTASFYVNKLAHLKVAKWLEFVFLRGVETLELDFRCRDPNHQVVLEELLMIVSGLSQTDDVISFRSLKSLCLQRLVVSGEVIKMLLCNCPSLEALNISFATLTSDVEVCGATLALKRLEIYYCKGNKSIKVSAPNLILLYVDDVSKLLLENVPKLVEATVTFQSSDPYAVQNFASAVFCFSSQLKTLYLTLLRPEIFLANGFSPSLQMPNLNKLVVDYGRGEMQSLLPITALIWAGPRLEEFKSMFTEIKGGAAVQVARDAERSPHRHLTYFELTGFMDGAVHHVELVNNYIVDNCVSLEKIIIRPKPPSMESYFKNNYVEELQAALDHAKQQLQGIIPQHIHLAI